MVNGLTKSHCIRVIVVRVDLYVALDGGSSILCLVRRVWCLSLLPRYDFDLAFFRYFACLVYISLHIALGWPPGIGIRS